MTQSTQQGTPSAHLSNSMLLAHHVGIVVILVEVGNDKGVNTVIQPRYECNTNLACTFMVFDHGTTRISTMPVSRARNRPRLCAKLLRIALARWRAICLGVAFCTFLHLQMKLHHLEGQIEGDIGQPNVNDVVVWHAQGNVGAELRDGTAVGVGGKENDKVSFDEREGGGQEGSVGMTSDASDAHSGSSCLVQWQYCDDLSEDTAQTPQTAQRAHPQSPSTKPMIRMCSQQNRPIFVPSFPGSGAEMFRDLIHAITGGIPGWSVYDEIDLAKNTTCHAAHAATCKTHWPVLPHRSPSNPGWLPHYHNRAIVLLRNPAKAFASRRNHLWENSHGLAFHSQQAPERAWNRWIRKMFREQIRQYADFVRQWATHPHYNVALYLQYEQLVNESTAPGLLRRVGAELLNAQVPHVASRLEDVQCLWTQCVRLRPRKKRAAHSYVPGYTRKQQQDLLDMLRNLIGEFNGIPDLVAILQSYIRDISSNQTRLVDAA